MRQNIFFYFEFRIEKNRFASLELHKDFAYCFEQILETSPNKTTAVRPLTFYLTNHS